jgi:hypothetical protein
MLEFACARFLLSGIPFLKVGHNVYRMIPGVIKGVRPIVPLPRAVAPISVLPFVESIHIEMEFGYVGGTDPALPSMYAPILLLIFVSIIFACKESHPKSQRDNA